MKRIGPSRKHNTDIVIQGEIYRWVPEHHGAGYWAMPSDKSVRVIPPVRGLSYVWRVWLMDDEGRFQSEAEFDGEGLGPG